MCLWTNSIHEICDTVSYTYKILHELPFNINFYQMSVVNVDKQALGELYNFWNQVHKNIFLHEN